MSLRLLCIALVLSLLLVSPVLAISWGPLSPDTYDQSTLLIARDVTGTNEWQWTFTLYHGKATATPIRQFSAGLLVDDTGGLGIGDVSSGHYYGYGSSISTAKIETSGNAMWLGFALAYGQTATFSFKTDLSEVGLASHTARDNAYVPTWTNAQTPDIPEPAGVLALMSGLVGLVGILRKK